MSSISKRNWSLNHTISCNGVTDSTNREGRNARTDSTLRYFRGNRPCKIFRCHWCVGRCDCWFFLHQFGNQSAHQYQTRTVADQYPLYAKDYNFLAHDSYICATNVVELPKADIVRSIENKHTKVVDTLKPEHLKVLLDKLRSSKLFSAITKKRYFQSANPDWKLNIESRLSNKYSQSRFYFLWNLSWRMLFWEKRIKHLENSSELSIFEQQKIRRQYNLSYEYERLTQYIR